MKTILFQGDSITDCGRVREENPKPLMKCYYKLAKRTPLGNGYPALITAELGKTKPGEYNYINKGVSGDRIPDVYARIVRDIIEVKPDYMSLLIGVNDVWHGMDWGNGTGIKRFEKVYDMLLEELKEELPETKLMILEPFVLEGPATADRADQPGRYKKFRSGVEEHAAIAKKLAEKYGVKFISLQNLLDEEAKIVPATELLSDGVHPTAKGHELIKREWLKAFNEL